MCECEGGEGEMEMRTVGVGDQRVPLTIGSLGTLLLGYRPARVVKLMFFFETANQSQQVRER